MMFFTDDRLRQAAQEAGAILDGSLPAPEDCPHTFSLPFQAKMAKLLRRHKRAPARRAMRRVACLVLVCLLGSGVFLTTNAQAREAFFGWVREISENVIHYAFSGTPSPAKNPEDFRYVLPEVPEGYEVVDHWEADGVCNELYVNSRGEYLSFDYLYNTDHSTTSLDLFSFGTEQIQVFVHGYSADFFYDPSGIESNTIVWWDRETEVMLSLSAYMDKDDLVALAESVIREEK